MLKAIIAKKYFLISFFYLISFIVVVVELALDDRLKDDFFHIYKNAAIETRDIQNKPVREEEVNFYLYSNENPNNFTPVYKENLEYFRNSHSKIIFLIHGWTNSRQSEWLEDMKNAFLVQNKNNSVIIVDWKEPANQLYYVSSINTYDTSKFIANILVELTKNYGVERKNLLLVGHSLGGQICGFTGKLYKKQTLQNLPRIIALDPAGPLFTTRPESKRLNKNDADIVEVIHTDGGTFGYQGSCGTIDFFVNGGSTQPGCKQIDLTDIISTLPEPVMCDHRRAWAYFTEAILNPTDFVAKRCNSWTEFKINYCEIDTSVTLGDLNTNLTGNFYLDTNKEKPYAKKEKSVFNLSKILG